MLIVKIGGGAGIDLTAVAVDLAGLGRPFVLVHGANRLRDELGEALGKPPQVVESVSGYTSVLSDDDAMTVLLAAYAGIRNKRLVEALRKAGVNALGLTGLDGGLVQGVRNPGIRVMRGGKKLLLRDNSGKPRSVNGGLLRTLLEQGYAPVLTVPMAGEDGSALNTENDEVLALLAAEMGATHVVSLLEAPGLLADPHDDSSLVREVDASELPRWEERVGGRMRRKIRALRTLFELAGTSGIEVRFADGRAPRPVSSALEGAGTLFRRASASPESPEGSPGRSLPAEAAPGSSAAWLERQSKVELDVYGKRGLALVWGEGARVRDAEGREYIDCIGGHGSLNLGHRHPVLREALAREAEAMWFVPSAYASPARTRFLERLISVMPPGLERAFLSNSGAEAVEAALKIARAHTGRRDFVAAARGFHGRTFGALSLTAEAHYRDPFEPLLEGVRRVPFNRADALAKAVDESVAAVVLEVVQGEGGVHIADPDYLRAAREACDRSGALLVLDEVQTGFGRTGRLFALEHSGVVPDILCLAKSIAGGLPLGATVVRSGITLALGTHGSTFGGNPVACAVAEATLEVLADGSLVEGAGRKGSRLAERLRAAEIESVREVRQIGLMIGVQLKRPVRPHLAALQERGVLALAAGSSVLRLLPPLVISDDDLDRVGGAVLEVLAEAPREVAATR